MSDLPSLPAPVTAFVDAINRADTDAFVALFTEDGLIDDWGSGARQWAGSDAIGAGARMTLLSADTDGQTVTTRFDWRSQVFNGESTGIFTVRGDELASFVIPPES